MSSISNSSNQTLETLHKEILELEQSIKRLIAFKRDKQAKIEDIEYLLDRIADEMSFIKHIKNSDSEYDLSCPISQALKKRKLSEDEQKCNLKFNEKVFSNSTDFTLKSDQSDYHNSKGVNSKIEIKQCEYYLEGIQEQQFSSSEMNN